MTADTLPSWRDTPARAAIVEFVQRVTRQGGADYLPPPERIAVFDNDGTLWCEKPMPIELGFILARLAEMAEKDATLRDRQPWTTPADTDARRFPDLRHRGSTPPARRRCHGQQQQVVTDS
jgi:hypothetical protein